MTALDVAYWFLNKESMTHKKIQKLCYYAQAWSYALYNRPLFEESIEAWVHGPVIRTLYNKFSIFGWNCIPKNSTPIMVNLEERELLSSVWEAYGNLDGDQLENLTHSETPWIEARGELRPWEICTKEISEDTMRDFYLKKYQDSQND